MRLLSSKPVLFGLRAQGHLPTVERMLAEGASWEKIGRKIGWDGATAERFYGYERAPGPEEGSKP